MKLLLLFHNNNGYANAPRCNIYSYIVLFANFDTRSRCVSFKSRSVNPRWKNPWYPFCSTLGETKLRLDVWSTQIIQFVPRTEPRFLCCLACGILDHTRSKKLRQQRNEIRNKICKWIQGAPTDDNGVPRPGMCLHVQILVQTYRRSLETCSVISYLRAAVNNAKYLNILTKTYIA
jgi:hypothetical protein